MNEKSFHNQASRCEINFQEQEQLLYEERLKSSNGSGSIKGPGDSRASDEMGSRKTPSISHGGSGFEESEGQIESNASSNKFKKFKKKNHTENTQSVSLNTQKSKNKSPNCSKSRSRKSKKHPTENIEKKADKKGSELKFDSFDNPKGKHYKTEEREPPIERKQTPPFEVFDSLIEPNLKKKSSKAVIGVIGTLIVKIISAKLSYDSEIIPKMDPYCSIVLNAEQYFKTKTDEDAGKDPVWGESFTFEIDMAMLKDQGQSLGISIYDKERYFEDRFIGKANPLLKEILLKKDFTENFILGPGAAGWVLCQFQFYSDISNSSPFFNSQNLSDLYQTANPKASLPDEKSGRNKNSTGTTSNQHDPKRSTNTSIYPQDSESHTNSPVNPETTQPEKTLPDQKQNTTHNSVY